MSNNVAHYNNWSSKDVLEWILAINPCKFEKYRNVLHASFLENNFSGANIDDLDHADLKQYGIINLNDRKLIYKRITKLIANQKKCDSQIVPVIHKSIPKYIHLIRSWIRQNDGFCLISSAVGIHFLNIILLYLNNKMNQITKQPAYGNGGWLPSAPVLSLWNDDLLKQTQLQLNCVNQVKSKMAASVSSLSDLINSNEIISDLTHRMIQQYKISHDSNNIAESRIESVDHMLYAINNIICQAPRFYGKHLIGLPLSALFTGINATLAGQTLFRIPLWNDAIRNILVEWCSFLYKKESFAANNGWLSAVAKDKWAPQPIGMDLWILPNASNPHWNSWNEFFARDINPKYRPLASPHNNNVITSANDGGFVRLQRNIKLSDTFWLKDMAYSLTDIFGGIDGSVCQQYAHRFVNGTILQTNLNPFDYHCFWAPVSGKIVCQTVLPGLYYSKLVVPDYYGISTASCPYLLHVNARGIFIIDTADTLDIGLVCCIPIGMVEVSSIVYEENISVGKNIRKGEKFGRFAFGGSSFALIFEDFSKYNKKVTFQNRFQNISAADIINSMDGYHSDPINVGSEIAVVLK